MKKYSLLAVFLLLCAMFRYAGKQDVSFLWIQHSLRKQICNEYIIRPSIILAILF